MPSAQSQEMPNDGLGIGVTLRDGNVVRVTVDDVSLDWKTVSAEGAVSKSKVQLSDLADLKITTSPASDEVVRIRSLVAGLADDDYRLRHQAEAKLMDFGKPFEKVIERARTHEEPEVRYRVERILKYLRGIKEDNQTRFSIDFDKIQLKDGTWLEGDLGDFSLNTTWNGTPLAIDRGCAARLVTAEARQPESESVSQKIATQLLFDEYQFYEKKPLSSDKATAGTVKPGYTQVNFDAGERGERMLADRNFAVGDIFKHKGIGMTCETNDGIVVISGYRFKKSSSKNRSVGNFFVDPIKKKKTSYQGVMRIDFCLPSNSLIPATVDMAAFFTEIVVPKETIVQAYNAAGHVIGLTQSTQDKMSFIGLSSNEPIAYLRISANTFLDVEKLNRDFAVDDFTLTEPKIAPELNFTDDPNSPIVITTRDAQRLLANDIAFDVENQSLDVTPANPLFSDFRLPLANIEWITPPQQRDHTRPDEGVYAMLQDGSVVHCQINGKLVSTSQPDLEIDPDQVIGIWDSQTECRYPLNGDFDQGNVILVQPLHRLAFQQVDFDWSNGRLDYDLDTGQRLTQATQADGVDFLSEKAKPEHLGIGEGEADPGFLELNQSPFTVWTQQPTTRAQGTGLLRTRDGQEFVLGGSNGFRLLKTDKNQIVLGCNGQEITFALKQIHALNLPR
ncbi:MAG: hypothetical protein P8J33_10600 [Pirellulaceae bacterium]|nr:hypothetical protein [Pirellulaceae bacterium]